MIEPTSKFSPARSEKQGQLVPNSQLGAWPGSLTMCDSSLKQCKRCGDVKPRAEFYRHAAMGDGLLSFCKECIKSQARANRDRNIVRIREYDRSRSGRPERVALNTAKTRAFRKANPEKYAAHMALNNAVRDGRVAKRACVVCGEKKVEAHHHDYSRPLDVIWLCPVHHRQLHTGRYIELQAA